MKNCLGIELGNYRIKIAFMEKNVLAEYFSERIENGEKADHRLTPRRSGSFSRRKMSAAKRRSSS